MKKNFLLLLKRWKDDADVLFLISENMRRIVSYVNSIVQMEYMQPIIYARYEGEDIRDRIEELDRSRRIAHDAAITAVTQLCRWAKNVGIPPIFHGDCSQRYEVAEFCVELVKEFSQDGLHAGNRILSCKSLDDYVKMIED